MSDYIIGFNILKQFLFGIGLARKAISISFAIFSIEFHWHRGGYNKQTFSFYNEWRSK